jgi:integrase
MISIRFFLHLPKKIKSPLYVRVHISGQALNAISTGISLRTGWDTVKQKSTISGSEWNHEKQLIKAGHDYAAELNKKLDHLRIKIGQEFYRMLSEGQTPTTYDLKMLVDPKKAEAAGTGTVKKPVTVSEFYKAWGEWYLAKKNRGNKTDEKKGKDYVRGFKQIVDKVNEFLPNAKLADFQRDPNDIRGMGLIEEFEDWVQEHYTLQDNTLLRYRRPFRAFFKFAGEPYEWLVLDKRVLPTKYSLTWDELQQLRTAKYSTPEIQDAAHVSIIISQLGLRWGDFSTLKALHFEKLKTDKHGEVWAVNKNQNKTGNAVYVPVPPMAEELLKLHNFVLPLARTKGGKAYRHELSEKMKDAAREAKLERQIRITKVFNGNIQEFTKPIHEIISPHDLRHTGATLIMEATRNRDTVKALLGHLNNDVTSGYIHLSPAVIADEILDGWRHYASFPAHGG